MSEFDKWFDEGYLNGWVDKEWMAIAFEAGQQSQQAKIDELKMSNHHLSVQLADSNAHYDHVKKERDELQGRIDRAIGSLKLVNHALLYEHIDHIINLLDGTTNEQ